VAATALGFVADAFGLDAVLWTIAALPVPALLLSLSLPTEPRRRLVVQNQTR
jgi:predicted MFS family arabinose efflux permease